ncbi:DUF1015 domain-containing protein [Candidatus Woesearchaeota archaeon]|nr:DUF1015 domain-containing protein [Candidatus Woesearchaeota archaeon]
MNDKIALQVPQILLPTEGLDLTKWAVVACDQFSSQPDYWLQVERLVSSNPSTFRLIFPEAFLEEKNPDIRIQNINSNMQLYFERNLLKEHNGFILVDRKTAKTPSRKGLIISLDLEAYDYNKGSQTLIRATEGTVIERLPPRIKIRENASIEVPHIMVLIDDPEKTVIEPLFNKQLQVAYDFDLMQNSGHIKGYKVDDEQSIKEVSEALEKLSNPELFLNKYNVANKGVLLYAVGDGNHSLATAKAIWEKLKQNAIDKEGIMTHPARYALVELVNVHDEGLNFEPIHRVLFDVELSKVLTNLKNFFGRNLTYRMYNSEAEMNKYTPTKEGIQSIPFLSGTQWGVIIIQNPPHNLAVGSLQLFLDAYIKAKNIKIDYVHGSEAVKTLASKPNCIGFFLPKMKKTDLFKTVIIDGTLPRKTFSMGEADEKRFYLECRRIIPEPLKKSFFEKIKNIFS